MSYSKSELGTTLLDFYGSLKSKKNRKYSKSALASIRAGVQRFLRDNNSGINIVHHKEFTKANQLLEGMKKKLDCNSEDSTKRTNGISQGDITKLYESGALSNTTPVGLQRNIFFELTLHCGIKGKKGLRGLRKDSFLFTGEGENLKAELKYNHEEEGDEKDTEKQVVNRIVSQPTPMGHLPQFVLKFSKSLNMIALTPIATVVLVNTFCQFKEGANGAFDRFTPCMQQWAYG